MGHKVETLLPLSPTTQQPHILQSVQVERDGRLTLLAKLGKITHCLLSATVQQVYKLQSKRMAQHLEHVCSHLRPFLPERTRGVVRRFQGHPPCFGQDLSLSLYI